VNLQIKISPISALHSIKQVGTNLVVVIVLYVLVTSVSCSPRRGGRTETSSNVCGRAQTSRGIRPAFSVITRFISIKPMGS